MEFRIRPIQVPEDFPRLVDIFNSVNPVPATVAKMVEWESKFPPDAIRERLVAVTDGEYIVGYGEAERMAWDNPGRFSCWTAVDEAYRGHGVGSALYRGAEDWARARGCTQSESAVRDNMPSALEFAQKRGYEVDRHIFDSTLDVAAFDWPKFGGIVDRVKAGGIRFFTYAEEPGEETQRKWYELNKATVADIPGWDQEQYQPFDAWKKWALDGPDVRTDCILFAADGDRLAGVTNMVHIKEENLLWTFYTAVHPDFRGRQIALALKLMAVETARRLEVPTMRTNNDSKNAPMLAVNRKMGYVPCPGHFRLKKPIK